MNPSMTTIPALRLRPLNGRPVRPDHAYVLYWMTTARRCQWNFGLDRAVEWAHALGRPLVILEALRCDYPWASARLHRFVLQGMAHNAAVCAAAQIAYYPYVEPHRGAGAGLLTALAQDACVIVGDDYPAFFVPRMLQAAACRVEVLLEVVDSNGMLPLRAADKAYATAYAFRRFLQRTLPDHLLTWPRDQPFAAAPGLRGARVAPAVTQRWPAASAALLRVESAALAALPVDQTVHAAAIDGGAEVGAQVLDVFGQERFGRYDVARQHPDLDVASGLSPYLHFGHVAAHQIFASLAERCNWDITQIAETSRGARAGWWGMPAHAEAFMDQLITWRELAFNTCLHVPHYDTYATLPGWAQATLARHATDPRPHTYSLAELAAARTADPVWNAAQTELVQRGTLQNYLRMLWGKKILEWTRTPQEALAVMLELNNRYAVDGRDPNSYAGIFWVLGRYDRPWPERPIFGTIRYMSSVNTRRKLKLTQYLQRFSPPTSLAPPR